MTPVIFCRTHNIDGRRIHDFCDLNERGEVSPGENVFLLHTSIYHTDCITSLYQELQAGVA